MALVPPVDPEAPKSGLDKAMERVAQLRPVTWFLINVGRRIDPVLMRASRGRLMSAPGSPVVLLTHRGAKSGKQRTTPLVYFTDGDNVVLIASKGGAPTHPAWYHNLKASPEVELWAKGKGGPYRARAAEGEERERLWKLANALYAGYGGYQDRATNRRIPVVVCEPR